MKEGIYAVYKGNEYRAGMSPDLGDKDIALIISENPEDLSKGFQRTIFGMSKKVSIKDLDTAYSVKNYALYKGEKLQISGEKGNEYILYTNNYTLAQTLAMDLIEPLVYQKHVNKNEIEKVWEEKSPIWGFSV